MLSLSRFEPVDYLIIGHLARDLTPAGPRLGGTAAYAALTAYTLGLRVGIVTSWAYEFSLEPYLGALPVVNVPAQASTTFENQNTPEGRIQILHQIAEPLDLHQIPESWREAPLVHLAPIAQEVNPSLVRHFPAALLGITPQGWLRQWDQNGRVSLTEWPEASFVLQRAGAAVISDEDVQYNEALIEEMVTASRVLAVTQGAEGARVYWHGDVRRFRAPEITEIDSTGAGDIFATAFFFRLHKTHNPWEAARFANELAAISVRRAGLASVPQVDEVQSATIEVF